MMTKKIIFFILCILTTSSCWGAETRSSSTSLGPESERITKLEQALESKENEILLLQKGYNKAIQDKDQAYKVLEAKYEQTISENQKLTTELSMIRAQVKNNHQPLLIRSLASKQHWPDSPNHNDVTLQEKSTQERFIAIDNRHTIQYNNQSIALSGRNILIMGSSLGLGLGGAFWLYKKLMKNL